MLHILIVIAVIAALVLAVLIRHSLLTLLVAVLVFVRDVFSDNGQASFSRVAAGIALICSLFWVNHIVNQTGAIPDLLNILILVGGLYGINKLATVLEAYVSAKAGNPPPPPGATQTVTAQTTIKSTT